MLQIPYIPSGITIEELNTQRAVFQKMGLNVDLVRTSWSFDELVDSLAAGDQIVIYSLTYFSGHVQLLASLARAYTKGLTVHSIIEPQITSELTSQFTVGLHSLVHDIHSHRTKVRIKASKSSVAQ